MDDFDDIQCEDYYGEEREWRERLMAQKIMDLRDDGVGEHTQSLWLDNEIGHLVVSRIPYDKGWETMIFKSELRPNLTLSLFGIQRPKNYFGLRHGLKPSIGIPHLQDGL